MRYLDVLYPHERNLQAKLDRYSELVVSMFMAALGAELLYQSFNDPHDLYVMEINLDNLAYYGAYYILYTNGHND